MMWCFSTFCMSRHTENICVATWANRFGCPEGRGVGGGINAFWCNLEPACTQGPTRSPSPGGELSWGTLCCSMNFPSLSAVFTPSRLPENGELNNVFLFSYSLKFGGNPLFNSLFLETTFLESTFYFLKCWEGSWGCQFFFWRLSSIGKLARLFLAKWYFQRVLNENELVTWYLYVATYDCPAKKIFKAKVIKSTKKAKQAFNPAFAGELRWKFSLRWHKQHNFFHCSKKENLLRRHAMLKSLIPHVAQETATLCIWFIKHWAISGSGQGSTFRWWTWLVPFFNTK